jgi:hypothetical protein
MAKTVKKTTTTAKDPAKSSKKVAAAVVAAPQSAKAAPKNITAITEHAKKKPLTQAQISHDQIAQLAHRFWSERGGRHGYHLEDWYRAERDLRSKAS